MLPTEDLFVYVYVLIHDLITAGAIAIPAWPRTGLQRRRAAELAQRGRVPGRGGP